MSENHCDNNDDDLEPKIQQPTESSPKELPPSYELISLIDSTKRLKLFCYNKNWSKPSYQLIKRERIGWKKFYTIRLIIQTILLTTEATDISKRLAKLRTASETLKYLWNNSTMIRTLSHHHHHCCCCCYHNSGQNCQNSHFYCNAHNQ